MKAAILDDYQRVAMDYADWSPVQNDIELHAFDQPLGDQQQTVEALQGYDVIVAMRERTPFPRAVIEALPNLKLLITTGAKNNSIDLQACADRKVTVCGTGSSGNPTVGITFGLMLELTRRIGFENARMKAGAPWQITVGRDLEGLTLGIVGLGKLGRRVADVAKAFGMHVMAWSQNLTREAAQDAGVAFATREALFSTADVVTIHYQLSERSRGLITAQDLRRMRPSAYLINTARAPIVDQSALLSALEEKRIAGAGLDVFETEPLPVDHPFRALDNVVLTPHLGYVSEQNYRTYFPDIVADIRAWLDGRPVRVLSRER